MVRNGHHSMSQSPVYEKLRVSLQLLLDIAVEKDMRAVMHQQEYRLLSVLLLAADPLSARVWVGLRAFLSEAYFLQMQI